MKHSKPDTRRHFLRTSGIVAAGSLLTPAFSNATSSHSSDIADDLKIVPSTTSSANDFDFLVGAWNIRNRKLKTRLNNSNEWSEFDSTLEMRKILNGIGNFESFKAVLDGKPFEGMAVRLFNPATRLWSIYCGGMTMGRAKTLPLE